MATQGFQDFESRVVIMDKVMEALKDDTVKTIYIRGIGGVGKTAMLKKIVTRVREEKLFDEVAMVVVSQAPDSKKIRDAIADELGLSLGQQSEEGRATQLRRSIVNIRNFLLVLDDVWNELQFADIGLPLRLVGYKILITSRMKYLLLKRGGIMEQPVIFEVPTLSEEEAWSLFKERTGNCCEVPDILPVAKQVVKECGGVPIAIDTVGNKLRSVGRREEWADALRELNSGRHGDNTHLSIMLSYNYLESEEHQRFFLLCCLFPKDADIPIETLLRFGIGLGILTTDKYSFQEARNRVSTLVNNLTSSFLLLESKEPEHVKIHVVVWGVGMSLASEDKENGLMIACKYNTKSNEVLYPEKLKLLSLSEPQSDIPFSFFEGVKNLNVLALSNEIYYDFGEQPKLPPLQFHGLENIQTLCLENYDLENIDISAIGALGTLEILSFKGSSGVWLPSELGLLTRLRLLDCRCNQPDRIQSQIGRFATIPELKISYGVFSGLKQLEELYLGNIRVDWEVEDEGKAVVNASLAEFRFLSQLTTLTITLPNAQLINSNDFCFGKLVRFQINMGCENTLLKENLSFPNCLSMSLQVEETIDYHMASLLRTAPNTTEILYLQGRRMTNASFKVEVSETCIEKAECYQPNGSSLAPQQLDWTVQLQNLRVLKVESCHNIEVLFDFEKVNDIVEHEELENATNTILPCVEEMYLYYLPKLKHVWKNGALACQGFQTLKILKIMDCSMKNLLAPSMAKHLRNLTTLTVDNCSLMEEIVGLEEIGVEENEGEEKISSEAIQLLPQLSNLEENEGEEKISSEAIQLLPQLSNLTLKNLQNLTSFCTTEGYNLCWPSLAKVVVTGCPLLKAFASAVPMPNDVETELYNTSVEPLGGREKVVGTGVVEQEFHEPSGGSFMLVRADRTKILQNLRVLEVGSCDSIEVFFDIEKLQNATNTILPLLEEMFLYDLPKMKHVWKNGAVACQGFQTLKILRVKDCGFMEHVVGEGEGENEERTVALANILFPQLVKLHFDGLQNLMSFFSGNKYTLNVEIIVLDDCPNLKMFSSRVVT